MNINWYPGHMAKAKRLISENLKIIDVIFEVIDARIPASSKIKDIDALLRDKPKIMILNKWDLCDPKESKPWVKYYENLGYKVINTNLVTKENVEELVNMCKPIKNELNAKRKTKGLKPRNLRIMVVGIPNVGKSTLINSLVKHKAVSVGNKPGITKGLSWIRLKDDMELMDTPGILWPKFEEQETAFRLASLTAIKEEVLPMQDLAIWILETMARHYPKVLKERYHLDGLDEDIEHTFEYIGRVRNSIIKGNVVEYEQVYRIILNDLKTGLLGRVTFDRVEEDV